jgi:hypothetical protein
MGYKCFDGLARMRQRANINASLADAIVPLEKAIQQRVAELTV